MKKVHIVSFGYCDYAFDSVTKATDAVKLFSNLKRVKFTHVPGSEPSYYYTPDKDDRADEVKLEMNQYFREAPKPESAPKPLALPKPKRGTIRCICGFSDVAPRQSCTHCGRPFSESHNRTHGADCTGSEHRRLL